MSSKRIQRKENAEKILGVSFKEDWLDHTLRTMRRYYCSRVIVSCLTRLFQTILDVRNASEDEMK